MVKKDEFTLEELQRRAGMVLDEGSMRNDAAHLMNAVPAITSELNIVKSYVSNRKPSPEQLDVVREKLKSVITFLEKFDK